MLRPSSAVAGALLALVLAGCGGDDPRPAPTTAATGTARAPATDPAADDVPAPGTGATTAGGTGATPAPGSGPAPSGGAGGGPADPSADPATGAADPPPRSWTATCPTRTPSALGCAAVRGRVLAVQSVDPDGDGDLHVIAVGGDVTGPGVTVFDVRPTLRPERDPEKGEYVTGAGPVFRGSLRQRQIQVDEFRVWRP